LIRQQFIQRQCQLDDPRRKTHSRKRPLKRKTKVKLQAKVGRMALLISFDRELITMNEEINHKFSEVQKNYLMQQQQFCGQSVSLN
jgi:hypothetical protein